MTVYRERGPMDMWATLTLWRKTKNLDHFSHGLPSGVSSMECQLEDGRGFALVNTPVLAPRTMLDIVFTQAGGNVCHHTCVEVRGHHAGVGSLFPACRLPESSVDHQTWRQTPFSAGPSCDLQPPWSPSLLWWFSFSCEAAAPMKLSTKITSLSPL